MSRLAEWQRVIRMITEEQREEARTALAHFQTICSKHPEFGDFIEQHGTDGLRREDCPHNPDLDEELRTWMIVWSSDDARDPLE